MEKKADPWLRTIASETVVWGWGVLRVLRGRGIEGFVSEEKDLVSNV